MKRSSALKIEWRHYTGIFASDKLSEKTIKNSIVILPNADYLYFNFFETRFLAEKVYITGHSSVFLYYRVRKSLFPNLKHLYLLSYPYNPEVLHRKFDHIYLNSEFYCYKHLWANDLTNITNVEYDDIMKEIASYASEPIIE
jgi:hypothetical protein